MFRFFIGPDKVFQVVEFDQYVNIETGRIRTDFDPNDPQYTAANIPRGYKVIHLKLPTGFAMLVLQDKYWISTIVSSPGITDGIIQRIICYTESLGQTVLPMFINRNYGEFVQAYRPMTTLYLSQDNRLYYKRTDGMYIPATGEPEPIEYIQIEDQYFIPYRPNDYVYVISERRSTQIVGFDRLGNITWQFSINGTGFEITDYQPLNIPDNLSPQATFSVKSNRLVENILRTISTSGSNSMSEYPKTKEFPYIYMIYGQPDLYLSLPESQNIRNLTTGQIISDLGTGDLTGDVFNLDVFEDVVLVQTESMIIGYMLSDGNYGSTEGFRWSNSEGNVIRAVYPMKGQTMLYRELLKRIGQTEETGPDINSMVVYNGELRYSVDGYIELTYSEVQDLIRSERIVRMDIPPVLQDRTQEPNMIITFVTLDGSRFHFDGRYNPETKQILPPV